VTPGRNDPCPCGSGKKYKHCCLRAYEAVPPEEVTWRRVRRAIDDLGHRILNAAMAHFGPTGIHEATGYLYQCLQARRASVADTIPDAAQ